MIQPFQNCDSSTGYDSEITRAFHCIDKLGYDLCPWG